MTDYYLKATDEAALWAALTAAGLTVEIPDPADELNQRPMDAAPDWTPTGATKTIAMPGLNLDIIGVIYRPTGNEIQQGEFTVPEMEPREGYHANIRGDLTQEQQDALPLIAAPAQPVRVWF